MIARFVRYSKKKMNSFVCKLKMLQVEILLLTAEVRDYLECQKYIEDQSTIY
jgi:hypothetical protein